MATRARNKRRGKSTPRATAHAKPIAGNAFLALLPTVKREVEARLLGLFDAKLDAASSLGQNVAWTIEAVRDLCMRGGKRLRAALAVTGVRSISASADLEPALDLGAALELLQTYFLIHDDWMDGDATRRGGPSVHTSLGERFGSAHAGASSAILAGDYAAALALEAVARADLPRAAWSRLVSCFAQMQADAVLGQQLDVIASDIDPETKYRLKTASYTVQGPLRLGALIAGASPAQLNALDRFAEPAGVAFQLRDDLLNAFGDPKLTGKPVGSDLREGKQTLLVALARKRARGRDYRLLKQACGNKRASERMLAQALDAIERVGAREAVEDRIAALSHQAEQALDSARITPEGRMLLDGAARVLLERRF